MLTLHYILYTLSVFQSMGFSSGYSKYFIFKDESGQIHIEDLAAEVKMKTVSVDDVDLYLYTGSNKVLGHKIDFSLNNLKNIQDYDSTRPHYFVTHGWRNTYESKPSVFIKNAILEKVDANVFVVDWGKIANQNYVTCHSLIRSIGELLAQQINGMIETFQISSTRFRLVGFSLGAHISGCIGAALNASVDYIIGLDPAGPLFKLKNKQNRLDESDANFVQVIHTTDTLGFRDAIGHADYYPNGGNLQPGCGLDLFRSCSHSRAYMYFAESIHNEGFTATHCETYKKFKEGECFNEEKSFLGRNVIDKRASGSYYLDTKDGPPYSTD
ncbi:hypothetical protein FQA39_LY14079 [Lamprigera yunnana]|nr:hypothetical protein FQA39_LY14079 [Lamprigera yunnana]